MRDKLGVVTRSFFAQRDFDDKAILVDLFRSFDPALARREGLDGCGAKGKGKGRADESDEEEERDGELRRAGEEGEADGPAGEASEPPLSPPPEDQQRAAEEEGGMYMGASSSRSWCSSSRAPTDFVLVDRDLSARARPPVPLQDAHAPQAPHASATRASRSLCVLSPRLG